MTVVLQFHESDADLRLSTRRARTGPERDLVSRFTEHLIGTFRPRSTRLALFFEPLLETGFPDVVVVEYYPHVFENWPASRLSLGLSELKVLQHIHATGPMDAQRLSAQLGLRGKAQERTLGQLSDAGLIRYRSGHWQPVGLNRVFGIKRLAAIEAKISDWTTAFRQAYTNTWFASETYVLSPVQCPTDETLRRSEALGVGIYSYTNRGLQELRPSARLPLPSCYASWSFNEWVGRCINGCTEGLGDHAVATAAGDPAAAPRADEHYPDGPGRPKARLSSDASRSWRGRAQADPGLDC